MIKKSVVVLNILLLFITSTLFSQVKELSLNQRIDESKVIFEGKVMSKYSFWNQKHTKIYTSNVVEVYKVFKGDSVSTIVEVLTEGGQVDNQIQSASELLMLSVGDVGIFMAYPEVEVSTSKQDMVTKLYSVYAGSQGFIRYNLVEKTASDVFNKYENIQSNLYTVITKQTGKEIRVLKLFDQIPLNESEAPAKKKKCSWSKLFKSKGEEEE